MAEFLRQAPSSPAFKQRGLSGCQFPLQLSELEIYDVDVEYGHDDFITSPTITHIYYVTHGRGTFVINEEHMPVTMGDLIEIPPGNTFAFSGRMKLLLIMSPPFLQNAIRSVGANPDVP